MNLSKVLQSPIKFKIISFFHRHPSTVDAARGVATWISQDVEDVEKALEELVSLNILIAHRTNYAAAYAYTQDKDIISKIDELVNRAESKE